MGLRTNGPSDNKADPVETRSVYWCYWVSKIMSGIITVLDASTLINAKWIRWSATYTSPRGLRISDFFYRRASWLDEKLSVLLPWLGRDPTTSRTTRIHNKQGVTHPTRSAIGRNYRSYSISLQISITYTVCNLCLLGIISKLRPLKCGLG